MCGHAHTHVGVPHRGKGWRAHQQLVGQDPDAPAVHLVGVADVGVVLVVARVGFYWTLQNLGGQVVNRAQPGRCDEGRVRRELGE